MTGEKNMEIIENYIKAYNAFDIDAMVNLLHKEIVFKNFSNGKINTETKGIPAFRELAEKSSNVFSTRHQTIQDYRVADQHIAVHIDYEAILAVDLSPELKSGDKIELQGKSIFEIHEGKISLIEDYS